MKKICISLLTGVFLFLFCGTFHRTAIFAMETNVDTAIRIYDYADLFTDEEAAGLSAEANSLSTAQGADVVIVSIDDDEGLTSMEYANNFYDCNGFSENGILMLINMDYREIWFSTCGSCIPIFTDQRIQSMVETAVGFLADGDYTGAAESFLEKAAHYFSIGAADNTPIYPNDDSEDLDYTPEHLEETPFQKSVRRLPLYLLLATAAAGITVFAMISTNKTAKKSQEASHYLENDTIRITLREDQFLRSTVSKVRIDNDSNSGGGRSSSRGSSVHTSSSGRSHGGGGGRF